MRQVIDYQNTNIRQYEIFIRDIANSFVQRLDFEKLERNGKTFLEKAKERFCFDSNKGWMFLTSSLDTIGDSQFAIVHFLDYKFENGKIFIPGGEHYLRLYGVLSAIYIQQKSILKLCDLFKVENLTSIKDNFDKLDITFLRHSISAHPTNFNNSKEKVSYKIDRNSLNDKGDLSVRDESNNAKTYNIFDAIIEYQSLAEMILENICIKVIENTHGTANTKKEELKEKLELIKNGR